MCNVQCTSLFYDFVLISRFFYKRLSFSYSSKEYILKIMVWVGVVDHLGHCQLGDQKLKAYLEHHIVQFEECYAKISVGILLMYFIYLFSEDYIYILSSISSLPTVFVVYTVHMYRIHVFMPAYKVRIKFNRKHFVNGICI